MNGYTMHLVQRAHLHRVWCEFDYDGKLMESDKMVKYGYVEVYKSLYEKYETVFGSRNTVISNGCSFVDHF